MESEISKTDAEIQPKWFSLRVSSGKERVVEENIQYELKMNDIQDMVDEVFVPFEKVVQIKNNKKKIKERVFFPGYILIKMALTQSAKYIIEISSPTLPKANKHSVTPRFPLLTKVMGFT